MQYINYYADFLAIYDECYADIIKMMRNKGVTRLEIKADEDYGCDRITTKNQVALITTTNHTTTSRTKACVLIIIIT